jgi:hypothetical protein
LRARADLLTTTPYSAAQESKAVEILEFAQMVDGNLAEWHRTLPVEWRHSTIGVVSEVLTPEAIPEAKEWPGEQHVYNDVPLASIMNDYRVCRIFCRRVILACLNWLGMGGHTDEGEYERSVFLVQQMVDEICACVPFHMNYDLQPMAKETGQEHNGMFEPSSLVYLVNIC